MKTTRRSFVQVVGATGAAAALTGCESASDALASLLTPEADADFRPPASDEIDPVSHVLNRVTFCPRPGDYQRVKSMGVDGILQEAHDIELDLENVPPRCAYLNARAFWRARPGWARAGSRPPQTPAGRQSGRAAPAA